MRNVYYYVLLNDKGGILVVGSYLPIYWLKSIAREEQKIHGGHLKKITHKDLMSIIKEVKK